MLFALIPKGKAAIGHLCPAGNQETAHPFFSQYLRRDMRIAMIAENQKPSTFVTSPETALIHSGTEYREVFLWGREAFAVSAFQKEFRSLMEGQLVGRGLETIPLNPPKREFGV